MQQLRDDTKLLSMIDFIDKNKSKHRGVIRETASELGISENHMVKISKGIAPYSIPNIRHLRTLANKLEELENEVIVLTSQPVNSLPAA